MRRLARWPEFAFIVIVALALARQSLIRPIVGLADSGDFSRLMNTVGLCLTPENSEAPKFLCVNRLYEWNQSFEPHYPTSELLFVGAALAGSPVLSEEGMFDIRLLGFVHVVGFLLVLLLLVSYTKTLPVWRRLAIYALVAFIFTDVGYVAYFNSLYSEPASFLFLCATVAFGVVIAGLGQPNRRGTLLLGGFFVSAVLLATAKFQNAPLALPLAFVGYQLGRITRPTEEKPLRRHRRYVTALVAALIVVSTAHYEAYTLLSRQLRRANVYNTVFYEILRHSKNPKGDAVELGLDSSLARYAGTQSSFDTPREVVDQVVARVSYPKILKFYLRHPDRLLDVSRRTAENAFELRPPYLGNFEQEAVFQAGFRQNGPVVVTSMPPEFKSHSFAGWSNLKNKVLPRSLWLLLLVLAVNTAAPIVKLRKYDRTQRARLFSNLHLALVVMAVMQLAVVIFGEGEHELIKHLFLFNLICDVCLVFLAAYALAGISALKRP